MNISSTLGALNDITNPESGYAGIQSPAYRMSKTLLNAVTALLAKKLRGSNILVNSVCPGWVRTDMGGPKAPLSPREAAATPVWLATLPDDGPTGGFFRDRQPIPWYRCRPAIDSLSKRTILPQERLSAAIRWIDRG